MFSALRDEELVQAKECSKEQGPFICPSCAAPVLLKKGPIKVPHFAHFLTTGCEYERGEGQLHHRIKAEICAALAAHPQVSKLQQERRELREVYPDISFCLNGRWYIAVELQVSNLAISTIQRRVEAYTTRGIALLWVLPSDDGVTQGALYQPTHWERYLHALYRKKLYYQPGFGRSSWEELRRHDVPRASWRSQQKRYVCFFLVNCGLFRKYPSSVEIT